MINIGFRLFFFNYVVLLYTGKREKMFCRHRASSAQCFENVFFQ